MKLYVMGHALVTVDISDMAGDLDTQLINQLTLDLFVCLFDIFICLFLMIH